MYNSNCGFRYWQLRETVLTCQDLELFLSGWCFREMLVKCYVLAVVVPLSTHRVTWTGMSMKPMEQSIPCWFRLIEHSGDSELRASLCPEQGAVKMPGVLGGTQTAPACNVCNST